VFNTDLNKITLRSILYIITVTSLRNRSASSINKYMHQQRDLNSKRCKWKLLRCIFHYSRHKQTAIPWAACRPFRCFTRPNSVPQLHIKCGPKHPVLIQFKFQMHDKRLLMLSLFIFKLCTTEICFNKIHICMYLSENKRSEKWLKHKLRISNIRWLWSSRPCFGPFGSPVS
jgi:hypothetical protein